MSRLQQLEVGKTSACACANIHLSSFIHVYFSCADIFLARRVSHRYFTRIFLYRNHIFLLALDHKVHGNFFRHNQGLEAVDSEDVFIEKTKWLDSERGYPTMVFRRFFLSHRGTTQIIHFRLGFSIYKPSSYWGSMYGNPPKMDSPKNE